MTWWGWTLVGTSVAFAGLCYTILWIEDDRIQKALPSDFGGPRRW